MLEVDTARVKPWLIQHLEPITDAEPATLAEYVLALLQRDETPQELERICVESLGDFLEGHTDKFVKEMLAFVRNPGPSPSSSTAAPPPPQRKRPLEDVTMNEAAPKRNNNRSMPQQEQPPQGQNGRLAKGMCRDYHMRGFCARGQACPYQHDAFATAQPPPGAFPQFPFPFGGQGGMPPQGQFPPGMRPGMPPFPMGFPPQNGQQGQPPFGQPGFPPQFGGPSNNFGNNHQQQQRQGRGQNQPRGGGRSNQQGPPHQQSPFPPSSSPPFPIDQPQPYPFSGPQQPPNKRRSPPSQSYDRPSPVPPPSRPTPTGPPPTPLTVLTHRFGTNASRQKELLSKLDSCDTPEAKKEVMTELRKLNKEAEEIMSMKKKVEEQQEKEKVEKEKKAKEAAERKASGESAKLPEDKEDLKAHLEKLRNEAASLGILPGQSNGSSSSTSSKPYPPSKRPYHHQPAPQSRTAQSFRLDNRSTKIVLESLESLGDPEQIKQHFESFGTVKEFEVKKDESTMVEEGEERGGEILIGFESRAIAEKAMSAGPPPSATLAKLRWAPSANSTTSAVSSSAPPATGQRSRSPEDSIADLPIDVLIDLGVVPWDAGMDSGDERFGRANGAARASSVERTRDDDDDERSWNR